MTSVSPIEYMGLIETGLSVADPTIRVALSERLPTFWGLSSMYCSYEIRYLVTLRSALVWLMGSVRQQIDIELAESESKSSSFRTSRQDAKSQSQADSSAASWSDSIGTSRYKDETDQFSDSHSRHGKATSSYSDSFSRYDDTGSGSSSRNALRTVVGSSVRTSRYGFSGRSLTTTLQSMSYTERGYEGTEVGAAGFNLAVGASTTGTNYAGTTTGTTPLHINDLTSSRGKSSGAGSVNGRSSNVVTGTDDSYSSFRNNISSHAESAGASQGNENMSQTAHSGNYGEGHGFSNNRTRSDSASRSQSKSMSHADGESHAGSQSESWSISSATKYHQRFLHLKDMHDEVNKRIQYMVAQLASNMPGGIGQLSTVMPEWCMCASNPRWRGLPC